MRDYRALPRGLNIVPGGCYKEEDEGQRLRGDGGNGSGGRGQSQVPVGGITSQWSWVAFRSWKSKEQIVPSSLYKDRSLADTLTLLHKTHFVLLSSITLIE